MLGDLLGLLNDLLGVLLDLFLLGLNNFLEVLDLLFQGSLLSLSLFLNSLCYLSGHLSGSFRSGGSLNRFSFLLNLLSFLFNSLDLLIHFGDLGGDNCLIILSLLLLGSLSLNNGFLGLNGGLESSDFVINFGFLSFTLDDCSLLLELLDLLLSLGDGLTSLFDSLLGLDDDNFVVVLSLSVVSLLVLNLLFNTRNCVSVSMSLLSDGINSVSMGVTSISMSNSIDSSSLSLLGDLNSISSLSLDSNIVSVVSSPGCVNGLNCCLD